MPNQTHTKKTESLEVRLSFDVKTEFMTLCRARGLTASEAVREFIAREVGKTEPRHLGKSAPWRTAFAAAVAGIAVGAAAAPSFAHSTHYAYQTCGRR